MTTQTTTYKFADGASHAKKQTTCEAIGEFIWNPKTKEFLGRDGASWGKVSLFYAIFYVLLSGFFFGMLAIFAYCFMSREYPTYYGETSVMNQAGMGLGFGFSLCPGLGFRPQIDPEDHLIIYDPKSYESTYNSGYGSRQYVENLRIFLEAKHPLVQEKTKVIQCEDGKDYTSNFERKVSCEYEYKKVFAETKCNVENNFGYDSNQPCVLVKLNKIYSWVPKFDTNERKVQIKCEGETSVDLDNIKSIVYHSENFLNNTAAGYIDSKYFPFMSQPSYRQPLVMVQFDVTPNVLVNVICRGYAANIDNTDRRNQRGMTKFSIFIKNQ